MSDTAGVVAQHWLISGRVQGVGYRLWLQRRARSADVQGWVRNLRDGRVEAVLAGDEGRLATLAGDARCGPDLAVVDAVMIRPWDGPTPSGPFGLRGDADIASGG